MYTYRVDVNFCNDIWPAGEKSETHSIWYNRADAEEKALEVLKLGRNIPLFSDGQSDIHCVKKEDYTRHSFTCARGTFVVTVVRVPMETVFETVLLNNEGKRAV